MGSAEEAVAALPSARPVDTGLLSLAVLARLQGQPAQPEQLKHELGLTGPASSDDLLHAAIAVLVRFENGKGLIHDPVEGRPRTDYQAETEVVLENKDVGFVKVGQHAEVKVKTFSFTRYGTLPGTVSYVSQDAAPEGWP